MSDSAPNTTSPTHVAHDRSVGWWLAYAAVVLAIVTSAAFGMFSLFSPSAFLAIVGVHTTQLSEGEQILAAYTGARELAIALTLLVFLIMRASRGVGAVMLLAAFANVFDFGHAVMTQRWVQAPGALIFAIIYLAAALWVLSQPARNTFD